MRHQSAVTTHNHTPSISSLIPTSNWTTFLIFNKISVVGFNFRTVVAGMGLGGARWESVQRERRRQHFGSNLFIYLFFKEQHALLIGNYNYPTMLPSQTPKTVPPLSPSCYTDLPSPIYLTWILRNFTDSILVKEIMVRKTKTINPYWRVSFPEWFPSGNHRTGKPALIPKPRAPVQTHTMRAFKGGILCF